MAKFTGAKGVANIFIGTAFSDTMAGNDLNDDLRGGNGDDFILGNGGNDSIRGQDGLDTLYGGAGNDTISAGNGNDFLSGDAGSDVLIGGLGLDTFAFNVKVGLLGNGVDTVTDFVLGTDSLSIANGSSSNVTFVQDGADIDVFYSGTQIATLLNEVYTGTAADYFV